MPSFLYLQVIYQDFQGYQEVETGPQDRFYGPRKISSVACSSTSKFYWTSLLHKLVLSGFKFVMDTIRSDYLG